jgi:hypothetical protein
MWKVAFLLIGSLAVVSVAVAGGLSARVVETYEPGSFHSRSDVGVMTSWPYPGPNEAFGIGIVFDGADFNLWISDFGSTGYGLYEVGQDGTLGAGYIATSDFNATDDLAYFDSEEGFIVGDYDSNALETYTETIGLTGGIPGPPAWTENVIFGVAFNNDDSIVYVSDPSGQIAYATMTDLTSDVTWTDLGVVIPDYSIPGLGYHEDDYLFVAGREGTDAVQMIYVYNTTAGVPDTSSPAFTYDITGIIPSLNGCEWDGDYLWVYERTTDFIYKLALDGISPDTGIQPMSLGNIKASFK